MNIQHLLFDLDGTLIDPVQGITRCLQYALGRLGRPVPPAEDLLWCIGPPLLSCFRRLLNDAPPSLADRALILYRERFDRIGKFESRVYDPVPGTLARLNRMGMNLFVATFKPTIFAEQIITHFRLNRHFKGIYGTDRSGAFTDKADLIDLLLRKENLDDRQTVMIGDRSYDMIGAKACNLKAIGVTYGYGTRKELLESRADWLAGHVEEIPEIISRANQRDPVICAHP